MSLGVHGVVRLGTDPELKELSGTRLVKFRAAVQDGKDQTSWFSVTAFGKSADFALEYLKKGRVVEIRGRITENKWKDKEGQDRVSYEVTADRLQFVPSDSEKSKSADQPF